MLDLNRFEVTCTLLRCCLSIYWEQPPKGTGLELLSNLDYHSSIKLGFAEYISVPYIFQLYMLSILSSLSSFGTGTGTRPRAGTGTGTGTRGTGTGIWDWDWDSLASDVSNCKDLL